jgi:hypothetical protein
LENFLEALMNTKSTIIFPYNMGWVFTLLYTTNSIFAY